MCGVFTFDVKEHKLPAGPTRASTRCRLCHQDFKRCMPAQKYCERCQYMRARQKACEARLSPYSASTALLLVLPQGDNDNKKLQAGMTSVDETYNQRRGYDGMNGLATKCHP
jgi:hypothetical protein